jgi:hypothetical protein
MQTEGLSLVGSQSVRHLALSLEILNNNKTSQHNEAEQRVSPARIALLPTRSIPHPHPAIIPQESYNDPTSEAFDCVTLGSHDTEFLLQCFQLSYSSKYS